MTHSPPPLDTRSALFLDFDGTLVDIARSPDAVIVEPGVREALQTLAQRLDGAVALVSGRAIADIDRHLAPLSLPVAGVHGAERRQRDGTVQRLSIDSVEAVAEAAERLAADHPGVRVERKGIAVALHYREAPDHEAICLSTMTEAVAGDASLHLMRGKMVVEVLPVGVSKGHAIEAFLREAPFAGRTPVFIGDDVTDEAGFEAVRRAAGVTIKVGDGDTLAEHRLPSSAAVRRWLAEAAAVLERP